MTQDEQSSEEAEKVMAKYGITHEQKSVYFCRRHKYDKLRDAIRYARDGLDRMPTTVSTSSDKGERFLPNGGYVGRKNQR